MNFSRIDISRTIGVLVSLSGLAALVGVVIGGDIGRILDIAAITALAVAPGARVLVLAVVWARARDYKFASASLVLVFFIVMSVIGTALWR